MCLEEGDQAEIRDRRGYSFYGTRHESGLRELAVGR